MGILASRPRVHVDVNGQQIAEMVIRGLGGSEAIDALHMMSERLAKNSDEVVASVDRSLASLTTDVHDAVQDFSATSDQIASSIHFALDALVVDIHNAILCFMVLMMTLTGYLTVLIGLRGLRERREQRLLLTHDVKMVQSIAGGSRSLVLVRAQTDEKSASTQAPGCKEVESSAKCTSGAKETETASHEDLKQASIELCTISPVTNNKSEFYKDDTYSLYPVTFILSHLSPHQRQECLRRQRVDVAVGVDKRAGAHMTAMRNRPATLVVTMTIFRVLGADLEEEDTEVVGLAGSTAVESVVAASAVTGSAVTGSALVCTPDVRDKLPGNVLGGTIDDVDVVEGVLVDEDEVDVLTREEIDGLDEDDINSRREEEAGREPF
ncbi:hypothetical protein BV22DRAFT_1050665 [Leucogyrophana mollusca]|uniref:Uncharacterized protein n=1 Tax=Leucogyrophana mollusca TaxID=85980 RepID=A0ACB8B5J5_9AGAM|nr:hypothetical protein BV22DRAFT_1050665 [Leucogyrophana mollusca]